MQKGNLVKKTWGPGDNPFLDQGNNDVVVVSSDTNLNRVRSRRGLLVTLRKMRFPFRKNGTRLRNPNFIPGWSRLK